MDGDDRQQPVLVIMGVSGCGKSTVAAILAGQLGWDLEEGDDLHPPSNVAKMASGTPLTDEDRWPWLDRVADWIRRPHHGRAAGDRHLFGAKGSYRDKLRGPDVVFVYLAGTRDTIDGRLKARIDHFMPSTLLDSQLKTLEPPGEDERALRVDVGPKPA